MSNNVQTASCCTATPTYTKVEFFKKEDRLKNLPIAIIGAGPVGLAAAAHLTKYNLPFIILEAGTQVGANIQLWSHVRLFSPWRYNIDKAAELLLTKNGWVSPDLDTLPTGLELIEQYFKPLANTPELKSSLHLNTKVLSVSRKNIDKMKSANRFEAPFDILTEAQGTYKSFEARAVIDSSGTWSNPNPSTSSAVWLKEELELSNQIKYGIPNIRTEKESYINKKVVVVGGGHSAINTLIDLSSLKQDYPNTEILWVLRRKKVEDAYGGEEKDALQARGALGSKIHQLVDNGMVQVVTPFKIEYLKGENGKITLIGEQNCDVKTVTDVDQMIVNTGSRPDFSMIREIRTSIDSITESVEALAPLIDPNLHSCGTVRPHGEKELRQPEKDFYIVGSKSYGRAPTFLMATGYEQVRSVAAYLGGDVESAQKVELDLPETGVCSINLGIKSKSCC